MPSSSNYKVNGFDDDSLSKKTGAEVEGYGYSPFYYPGYGEGLNGYPGSEALLPQNNQKS